MQLPMLVRGFYYEGWHPAGKPNKECTKEEFLAHVREYYVQTPEIGMEQVVRGAAGSCQACNHRRSRKH